jgi:catechol 2,3-dioxygenase-like lactoylglutathione lyase family enzyme
MTNPVAQPAPLGLSDIGQIAITVRDLKQATAFYRDILGIKLLFEVPNMSFFDCGGLRLMVTTAEKPEFDHPASILYFRVPDIHAAYETLVARGVRFEDKPHFLARMPDHELWLTFFRDMDNNLFALMSEVRNTGQ